MISVSDARLILEDNTSDDTEIQETIDTLQLLVELTFDKLMAERKAERQKNEKTKTEENPAEKLESPATEK